jgi:signal transduction histidine kinase
MDTMFSAPIFESLLSVTNLIVVIFSVCINFFLAYHVYHQDKTSYTNRFFAILAITLSIWLSIIYTSTVLNQNAFSVTFWPKLSLFFAAPMTMFFFFFAHTFPAHKFTLKKQWVKLSAFSTGIVMAVAVSPYSFDYIIFNETYKTVAKIGMAPFAILTTIFSIASVYQFVRRFHTSDAQTKKQLQYITTGLLLMTGMITLTILIPVIFYDNNQFVVFSPIYTLIFLGLTAYAIVKHKLFDIKVLATEIFVVILTIFFFTRLFLANSFNGFVLELIFFLSTIFFGNLLIRSVSNEVHQRNKVAILNQTLEKKNTQLQELVDLKTEFIGIASHQLRTPLTVLRGLLDMQYNGDLKDLPEKRQRELQHNMLVSASRLTTLINDLMDSTKMEGGISLELQELDTHKLIKQVANELQDNFKKKNLRLSITSDGKSGLIEADPKFLHEALTNIVDNAEKYTLEGGILINTKKTNADTLEISITDTGIGLTEDDHKKLYIKFSRGIRSQAIHTEGSGLGVYIIKRIIEAHNGKLEYQSEGEGKGTTVTITLPIKQPKE